MREIVFLSRYAGFFGGVERYMLQASERLRRAGYTTRLVYQRQSRAFELYCAGFDRVEEFSEATDFSTATAITVHKFDDADALTALLERERRKLVLFVHDHDFYCPRHHKYTFIGRRNCSRPYRFWRCNYCAMAVSPSRWKNGGLMRFLNGVWRDFSKLLRLYRAFPQVVVLSDFMRNNLLMNGFSPESIRLIPPAVELPEETEPPNEERLLFIGQLIRGKGCAEFLRMLALLRRNVVADVVGDGNELESLKRLTAELGLTERVHFALWQTDSERFFKAASMVVLPFCWQEPFGLTGLEAAAHGRAVVAYDLGGCREWLKDGATGFAVKPGDTAELARRVEALLDDPEKLRAFGANGRRMAAADFSETEFLAGFERLVEGTKRTGGEE